MASYQLYSTTLSGERVSSRNLEAESDESAAKLAEAIRGLSAMELWCGGRRIKRWDPFPPSE